MPPLPFDQSDLNALAPPDHLRQLPDTLADRLARLRSRLDRAGEIRDRPDPLASVEIELRCLERLLKD